MSNQVHPSLMGDVESLIESWSWPVLLQAMHEQALLEANRRMKKIEELKAECARIHAQEHVAVAGTSMRTLDQVFDDIATQSKEALDFQAISDSIRSLYVLENLP